MKDTPILFSGPLVRSVMSGRKTMTRRVIVPQPGREISEVCHSIGSTWLLYIKQKYGQDSEIECPYGGPGDRLWVRENHAWLDYQIDGTKREQPVCVGFPADDSCYRFEPEAERIVTDHLSDYSGWRLRPSIHMPRWASRITLEITAVCAERLQQISEEDAIREGINCEEPFKVPYRGQYMATAELRFSFLWDSIYKKTAFNWDANPWVWVISFRRISQ